MSWARVRYASECVPDQQSRPSDTLMHTVTVTLNPNLHKRAITQGEFR